MVSRVGIAITLIASLMLIAAIACESTPASPALDQPSASTEQPVQPTETPAPTSDREQATQPVPAASEAVSGTVAYRERIALSSDAIVEIKLVDVSRADAPAITIGEQIIENPGQVPIAFKVEYNPEDIDERFTYAIQVRIMEGNDLKFINTTQYQVITRGNPTQVDLVLAMVGSTSPVPTPPVTPQEPEMAEAPAPVESVEVVVSESTPPEYSLTVISRLPRGSSCSKFGGFELSLDGTTVMVTMINLEVVAQNVPCTADLPVVETDIPLGNDFNPGETYTVVVNGQVTNSFVARDPEGREMVEKTSPVESVEVVVSESTPPEYSLAVISRLPMGSSCSQFNGFDIVRQFAGKIDITVTHLEVAAQNVPCTADLPVVSTDIPLGSDFNPGETYTVVVNGQVTNSFVARDSEGREMVEKTSPVEGVEVVVSESTPPEYSLVVISRLPMGSSCSQFNGFDIVRQFAGKIDITVTHLEVAAQNVPCTRDLPVVSTDIPLGNDFISGETYTVVVNDDVVETFVAQ